MSPNGISEPRAIVVTGGAGFVGSPLVRLLLDQGPVCVIDNLSVGRPMPEAAEGLTCHRADIRDRGAMMELFDRHRPEAVVHLAAVHHIPTCERDPHHATDVNVMGFQSVLDACAQSGCRRVVLASSGAIYDWAEGALAETSPIAPRDVYSASKAANEHQLAAWVAAGRGCGAVARMFNVIGPHDPNGHLIPDILGRLAAAGNGRLALRMGNLERRRDFVDVEDMAAGLAALVRRAWPQGPEVSVSNLCSGREHSVAEIAERLAELAGVCVDLVSDPGLCRSIDRPSQLGDPTKTAAELGWRATRHLGDSLAAIVRQWRQG